MTVSTTTRHFLLASDFDQTLSFNDSGHVLAELLGISGYEAKVEGLARSSLVQQGGELAYLIRHDPEFRGVRRAHLAGARGGMTMLAAYLTPSLGWMATTVFAATTLAPRVARGGAVRGERVR